MSCDLGLLAFLQSAAAIGCDREADLILLADGIQIECAFGIGELG